MTEMSVVIADLIQCFEWNANHGVLNMDEGPGLTAPRAEDFVCVPLARQDRPMIFTST